MQIVIHASNIQGGGARWVVSSLLRELLPELVGHAVTLIAPPHEGFDLEPEWRAGVEWRVKRRWLPNAISRWVECSPWRGPLPDGRLLVLGDIPLHGRPRQVVLVHQAHLLAPTVNPEVGAGIKYRIARRRFAANLRFVGSFLVQSAVMGEQLAASYGIDPRRIVALPHPAPFAPLDRHPQRAAPEVTFFYPAADYPHKNHRIFAQLHSMLGEDGEAGFRIVTTAVPPEVGRALATARWFTSLGQISGAACQEWYRRVDGVVFPSLLESYGLPLLEGMQNRLAVVAADLPYARWMCGTSGVYFDPRDPSSLLTALRQTAQRITLGWSPEWSGELAKVAPAWRNVAQRVRTVLEEEP